MDYAKIAIPDTTDYNFLPVADPNGQTLELYFQGKNLKDLDTFSKSDPQVRVHIKENPTVSTWKKIGETEII